MLARIWSEVLTRVKGLGCSLLALRYRRMASSKARTLWWEPVRIWRCVRSPNQRSTWLIHGVDRCEVQMEPGMAPQAPIDRGSFVSDAVVHHEMDIEVGWDFGVNALQESEKLTGAMAPVEVPDHLAAADGQGGEQGGGSVTTVVMGLAPQRLGTVQRLNL